MLKEVTLRFKQVTRLQYKSLGLVQDVQIEHARTGTCLLVLDALQLTLDSFSNRLEEAVALLQNLINILEIVVLQHLVDVAIDRLNLIVDVHQVLDLLLGHTLMVVVDMIETGTCDMYQCFRSLTQVIDNLYVVVRCVDITIV